MNEPTVAELLETAVAAAKAGGSHAAANASRRTEYIQTYAHDVKLALDVECQLKIEKLISDRFPEHSILGEEDETVLQGSTPGEAKKESANSAIYEWIVDPIDGTVNFSHGFPAWCCSVAVRRGDDVLAAAVYAPDMDALYSASIDTPAMCNGQPLNVSGRTSLAESLVMTGLDKNLAPGHEPLAIFRKIAFACQKTRVMGSAALDLCMVARGAADGYFESGIYIWDISTR